MKIIDRHVIEITEKEQVTAPGFDVFHTAFPFRHLGPRGLNGVKKRPQTYRHENDGGYNQMGVRIQLGGQISHHHTQHDSVDGQHDVGLIISDTTQVNVGPIGGAVHRLHPSTRFEIRVSLFLRLLNQFFQLFQLLFLLFGVFQFFQISRRLIREQRFLAFVELLDVLALPVTKHVPGSLGVVFMVEHKGQLKIDPLLIGHDHVPGQRKFLPDAATAVPVTEVSQMAEVSVRHNFFEKILWLLRHFCCPDASADISDELLIIHALSAQPVRCVDDTSLFMILPATAVSGIMKPGSQDDGQPVIFAHFVMVRQLRCGFRHRTSMLKIVKDEGSVNFFLNELFNVCLNGS